MRRAFATSDFDNPSSRRAVKILFSNSRSNGSSVPPAGSGVFLSALAMLAIAVSCCLVTPAQTESRPRASVTAEVDFSQSESTSELFKPNQGDAPAAVKLVHVGDIPSDITVRETVLKRQLLLATLPGSPAGVAMTAIATRIEEVLAPR